MILYLQQNIAVAFFSKQIRPNFNYNGGIYYGKHKKAPMVGIRYSVLPVWGELFGARVRWGG